VNFILKIRQKNPAFADNSRLRPDKLKMAAGGLGADALKPGGGSVKISAIRICNLWEK
jgi:hypothetical protein